MTDNRQPVNLDLLPHAIDAVLDHMPTGATWRHLFDLEPGIEVTPTGPGWLAVTHRGDQVLELEAALLDPDGRTGRARFADNGQPAEIHLGRQDDR